MKKTDFSSLDGYFQDIHDNIQSLLDHIDEDTLPSRDQLVQSLYINQLEGTRLSEVLTKNSFSHSEMNSIDRTFKTNYERIVSLIDSIEQHPDLKNEILDQILSKINGISDNDKVVIKDTFLNLEEENLKNAIIDVISAFISKEE